MNTDVLNLIIDYATVRDGRPDTGSSEQAAERRKGAVQGLDLDFALEFTDRLGEEIYGERWRSRSQCKPGHLLRRSQSKKVGCFSSSKTGLELRPGAEIRHNSNATACGFDAFAVLAGVTLDGVLGGIAAVGGIMVMAAEC
jgi:hypothetical protein